MIKKQDGKWLVDIQPGGRGHRRFRKTFDTKAQAQRYELMVQSRVSENPDFSTPKKDLRKLTDFVELWYQSTGQFLNSGTFASHYMMNGGNILALQKLLGHSSLNMTMKYAHLAPDYLREVLKINPALTLC